MKRVALLLATTVLIVSLAAPSGAAFASIEETGETNEASPVSLNSDTKDTTNGGESSDRTEEQPRTEQSLQVSTAFLPVAVAENPPPLRQDVTYPAIQEGVSVQALENNVVTALAYPAIAISELQVDGTCDGADWCTKAGDNVEFVELYNPSGSEVSLEGWKLRRQATGTTSQVADYVTFGKTGIFPGEYVVVSTGLKASDTVAVVAPLPSNLSNSGGSLFLVAPDGTIVDMVGWGAAAKSHYTAPAVAPATNQSVQRCMKGGVLQAMDPRNNATEMLVYEDLGPTPGAGVACVEPPIINFCEGILFSEIAANVDDQFIELYNPGPESALLDGCRILTNRSTTKAYIFPEQTLLDAGTFITVSIIDTDLALTKTTTGTVYLLSSDGTVEVANMAYANLTKGTSWALVGDDWKQTYTVTPGAANIYEQYAPCESGYSRNLDTGKCNKNVEVTAGLVDCGEGRERNPDTGRCRNIPAPVILATCKEGQYRSEETNRCRSIAATAASVLKPCGDDQFRNPATNRCKSIASADDLASADCGEGRERNPETNRCRNVLLKTPPEAAFAIEPTKETAAAFTGWWILGALAMGGVGYGLFEWRYELAAAARRVLHFTTHTK